MTTWHEYGKRTRERRDGEDTPTPSAQVYINKAQGFDACITMEDDWKYTNVMPISVVAVRTLHKHDPLANTVPPTHRD